jgi:dihydrofolate reductase
MRKLVLHMITSIDGFISDPDDNVNPEAQWDEEMQAFYLDLFTRASGVVFGRRLYEQYIGRWSRVASEEIAAETDLELRWTQRLMEMDKFIVSNTLTHLDGNTEVLGGDVAAELTRLKSEPGGDLLLLCGPSLFAYLTDQRLIDGYMLYMCPSALGKGTHLFRDISAPLKLTFERSVPFKAGVNLHYYTPATSRRRANRVSSLRGSLSSDRGTGSA